MSSYKIKTAKNILHDIWKKICVKMKFKSFAKSVQISKHGSVYIFECNGEKHKLSISETDYLVLYKFIEWRDK